MTASMTKGGPRKLWSPMSSEEYGKVGIIPGVPIVSPKYLSLIQFSCNGAVPSMAFALFTPSNPPFPLSTPPLSPLISFPSFTLTLHLRRSLRPRLTSPAHPSPHTLPPVDEDNPPPSARQPFRKSKRKHKLKPNFYEQAVDRWSATVSSQRSTLPWQQQQQQQQQSEPQSGVALNNQKNTELGIEEDTQLGEKSSLGVIVDMLDGSPDRRNAYFNEVPPTVCYNAEERLDSTEAASCPPVIYTPARLVPPWARVGSITQTSVLPESEQLESSMAPCRSSPTRHTRFESSHGTKHNSARKENPPPLTSILRVMESTINRSDTEDETPAAARSLGYDAESGESSVGLIIENLQNSLDQSDDVRVPDSDRDVDKLMVSVSFPWEREGESGGGERLRKRSNTELAETTVPEIELRRLRKISLRMKERMKVGVAGVTEAVVESIREKWKESEVVKLKFEGPCSLNMRRTHEILERKTGGLVIWRSGSSLVLYRGMTYELPCVRSYSQVGNTGYSCTSIPLSDDSTHRASKSYEDNSTTSLPSEGSGTSDIDSLLDQLGPRFKDWSGRNPLPVDADLLPGVVAGYKPPFRLLPYKTRTCLTNREMTSLRRLARTIPPHFALGRNRQHQGLANSMVKLWGESAIAKIAIKRGVPNTCNERMAEEIKKLTGGIILSRNKEYIVFYRGNDFLKPSLRDVLAEKDNLATIKQDEEEVARLRASTLIISNAKTIKSPLVAGTLAETMEANARWANQPSSEDREKLKRDLDFANHVSLVRFLGRKLAFAQTKVRKAEKALAKVQEFLQPAEIPTDLETVTDEERFLFRRIGLKMRAFLLLGRRDVFDGTIQNMHLNWKHRELVKIIVKGKSFAQLKHIAISLEAESGGVLISLDKTTKGYAIIMYRGKNYHRPQILRPKNLLTKRQALTRSIELQRREALNHHISNLRGRIQALKSQLDKMRTDRESGNKDLDNVQIDDSLLSYDDVEDEGEEAYLETYSSSDENGREDEAST